MKIRNKCLNIWFKEKKDKQEATAAKAGATS